MLLCIGITYKRIFTNSLGHTYAPTESLTPCLSNGKRASLAKTKGAARLT